MFVNSAEFSVVQTFETSLEYIFILRIEAFTLVTSLIPTSLVLNFLSTHRLIIECNKRLVINVFELNSW